MMTRFRDLQVGDRFDLVGPDRFNSYFRRCVKLSSRTYTPVDGEDEPAPLRVGSVNVEVFNVEHDYGNFTY